MTQDKVKKEKKAYTSQENAIWIFLRNSGRKIVCCCLGSSDRPADDDYGTASICFVCNRSQTFDQQLQEQLCLAVRPLSTFPPYFRTYYPVWGKRIVKPNCKSYSAPGSAIRVSIQIESRLTCPCEWRNPSTIRITVPVWKGGYSYSHHILFKKLRKILSAALGYAKLHQIHEQGIISWIAGSRLV